MAFTTLPTYGTGDTVTAANWNTYIKDNFAASAPDIFTATGEIFVGEGADTGGLLSPSVIGKVLIVDAAETLGVKYSDTLMNSKFIFGYYGHADYNNDTFGGTTVSISIHDATGYNVPATANMIFARLRVLWHAGSTDDYIVLSNTSDSDMEMLRIDYNALRLGEWMAQQGFVVPADGNVILEITDSADVSLNLKIVGYVTS